MKYVRWDVKSFRSSILREVSISCDIVGDAALKASSLSTDGKEKQNFFFSDLPAKENCASVHNALPPENVACCTSLQSPPFPLPARVTKRTLHVIMTVLNLESSPSMQG